MRADGLEKFVDALPIPLKAVPSGVRNAPAAGTPYYRAIMQQVTARVHRDLPPTRFWSFGSTFPGPTYEMRRGQGALIEWTNRLPARHFLPIDPNIHGAERDKPEVRTVVHVHGARVPAEHDGYPERWFVPGSSATYYYPNDQDAATLWYHDHTMGINRLNVYAGLLGIYLIRDDIEDALNLPQGRYELPLIMCDRLFRSDGQLDYPASGDPAAPWVDDVAGDALLINGKLFPFVEVEPRKYRVRLINASNGRFLRLTFAPRQRVWQIGTDQGLLSEPVETTRVSLAPAERVDTIMDFSAMKGRQVTIENDGQPVMQMRVSAQPVGDTSRIPDTLRAISRLEESPAVKTRLHSLREEDDLLAQPVRMLLNGLRWHMPVTEQVAIDTTEIWSLVNHTDESHPIHLHLVRFQILDRRKFDRFIYESQNRVVFTGAPVPPEPGELGWKDTVRADPGMVTRIIIRFEGYPGRYMWHCHVLEHGDNEMMRPLEILPAL
jgi:spore coat protein A